MAEQVTSKFRIRSTHLEFMFLRDLEQGNIVSVRGESYYHGSELWNPVKQFSEGDIVKMTIESQNKMMTAWEVTEVINHEKQ